MAVLHLSNAFQAALQHYCNTRCCWGREHSGGRGHVLECLGMLCRARRTEQSETAVGSNVQGLAISPHAVSCLDVDACNIPQRAPLLPHCTLYVYACHMRCIPQGLTMVMSHGPPLYSGAVVTTASTLLVGSVVGVRGSGRQLLTPLLAIDAALFTIPFAVDVCCCCWKHSCCSSSSTVADGIKIAWMAWSGLITCF